MRLEKVAGVPSTVPEPLVNCTVIVSYTLVVEVCPVLMCSSTESA